MGQIQSIFRLNVGVGWVSVGFPGVIRLIFLVGVFRMSAKRRIFGRGVDVVQVRVTCDLKGELIRGCLDKASVKH
jgi:hypothetical protein